MNDGVTFRNTEMPGNKTHLACAKKVQNSYIRGGRVDRRGRLSVTRQASNDLVWSIHESDGQQQWDEGRIAWGLGRIQLGGKRWFEHVARFHVPQAAFPPTCSREVQMPKQPLESLGRPLPPPPAGRPALARLSEQCAFCSARA